MSPFGGEGSVATRRTLMLAIAVLSAAVCSGWTSPPKLARRGGQVFRQSRVNIDERLTRPYRKKMVPMGCSGKRVWALYPAGWGFARAGRRLGVNVLMYMADLAPYDIEIRIEGKTVRPGDTTYFPSHLSTVGAGEEDDPRAPAVSVRSSRFITWDDACVTVLEFESREGKDTAARIGLLCDWSPSPVDGRLERDGMFIPGLDHGAKWLRGAKRGAEWSLVLDAGSKGGLRKQYRRGETKTVKDRRGERTSRTDTWELDLTIPAGGGARVTVVWAVNTETGLARREVARVLSLEDPLSHHVRTYSRWYDDNIAYFECSDPWVTKTYYHRWYLVRKNLMLPGLGRMKWWCCSEGRGGSAWYAQVISFGAPHHIRELRWLRDPRYVRGVIRTWMHNARGDGVFGDAVEPEAPRGGYFCEWITSTVWDAHLVHPDRALLEEVFPAMVRNVQGQKRGWDRDGDGLLSLVMPGETARTGMEYTPSWKMFPAGERVVRVDYTSELYGNAVGAARAAEALGEKDAARELRELSAKVRHALQERCWDDEKKFFFHLREKDYRKAYSWEISLLYPWYFRMPEAGKGFEAAFEHVVNPEEFWTPWPVASLSRADERYSDKSYWNGPSWPHANSVAVVALANAIRTYKSPVVKKEHILHLFSTYGRCQYLDHDIRYPDTRELYSGVTGRMRGDREYLHSTYADGLLTVILGIIPREDDILEIDPLLPERAWDYFVLDGQRYRGHDVTIAYRRPGAQEEAAAHIPEGMTVWVDGARAAARDGLGPLRVSLAPAGND